MQRQTAKNLSFVAVMMVLAGAAIQARADAGWGVGHWIDGLGSGVSGSGTIRTESREIAAFDSIDLRDSTDIDVRIGSAVSLTIEADDNILPLISTDVRGTTLTIKSAGSYHTRHSPKVIVTTPSLSKLSLNGSGDAQLHHVSGSELSLRISGSGDIRADGDIDNISLKIDGSGDADLVALQARSATVSINGSGDASLSVVEALNAVVNGSGDIRYHGSPTRLSKRVSGSGDISQR